MIPDTEASLYEISMQLVTLNKIMEEILIALKALNKPPAPIHSEYRQ